MVTGERIRESRKLDVSVGELKFFGRRPSFSEASDLLNAKANCYDVSRKFITGWENVKERHIFPGGSDDNVEFSDDVFNEFISDSPEVAVAISDAVLAAFNAYMSAKETLQKN